MTGNHQVEPGGVPPLVVMLRGDLAARLVKASSRWLMLIMLRFEIGRSRARMQVKLIAGMIRGVL